MENIKGANTDDCTTHEFLTKQGIHTLTDDMPWTIKYLGEQWPNIVICSTLPDTYENDKFGVIPTYAGHFYDYSTGLNYKGNPSPTALTRFNEHYPAAVAAFKNHGNWVRELGYALHYFEDATAPFHAANDPNYLDLNTDHGQFEDMAEAHHHEYAIDYTDLYALAQLIPPGDFLQRVAHWAKATYINHKLSYNSDYWQVGMKEALINAQKAVPALIYKFLLDCGERPPIDQMNIALGKTATQSSRFNLNPPGDYAPRFLNELDLPGHAAKAVDGSTNGNWNNMTVTHTLEEANPWWEVDLAGTFVIRRIEIYNRTDCCSERLQNFVILIKDQSGAQIFESAPILQFPPPPNPYLLVSIPEISGRYVKIFMMETGILSLAEVKVFQTF